MQILRDGWTPLFNALVGKVSQSGRKTLLAMAIAELYDLTLQTFGAEGANRPSEWPPLSPKYALRKHEGDRTPTATLSGAMKNSFSVQVTENSATLSNSCPYFQEQQEGGPALSDLGELIELPARPMMPIAPTGDDLTPQAKERLLKMFDRHFSPSQFPPRS